MRTTTRTLALALVMLLLSSGGAGAKDSVLYALTENMALFTAEGEPTADLSKAVARWAVAALQGTANLGTPWCPVAVLLTNPKTKTCTLTALGEDFIGLVPGPDFSKGWVKATGATVVQGDNPTDGPEAIALTWTFNGTIDLSQAAAGQAPLGFLKGHLLVNDTEYPLIGTFRLPFVVDKTGRVTKPRRDRDDAPDYDENRGDVVPVRKNEPSRGTPTVKFEVTFIDTQ